jgi:hypothetical protein
VAVVGPSVLNKLFRERSRVQNTSTLFGIEQARPKLRKRIGEFTPSFDSETA